MLKCTKISFDRMTLDMSSRKLKLNFCQKENKLLYFKQIKKEKKSLFLKQGNNLMIMRLINKFLD